MKHPLLISTLFFSLLLFPSSASSQGVADCAGVEGGWAYLDDCGNCVGGTTGASAIVLWEEYYGINCLNATVGLFFWVVDPGGPLAGLTMSWTIDGVEQEPVTGQDWFIPVWTPYGNTVIVTFHNTLSDACPVVYEYTDNCVGVCDDYSADAGPDAYVFIGPYTQPCVTLQGVTVVDDPSGDEEFFYLWTGGSGSGYIYSDSPMVTVCPATDTNYSFNVFNMEGCVKTDQVLVEVIDTQCYSNGNTDNKVTVCINGNTTCIGVNAVEHLIENNPNASVGPCTKSLMIEGSAGSDHIGIKVYPNPNDGQTLMLYAEGLSEDVTVIAMDMFDMFGKQVLSRQISMTDGFVNTTLTFDGDLAAGMYLMNITAGERIISERLIVRP